MTGAMISLPVLARGGGVGGGDPPRSCFDSRVTRGEMTSSSCKAKQGSNTSSSSVRGHRGGYERAPRRPVGSRPNLVGHVFSPVLTEGRPVGASARVGTHLGPLRRAGRPPPSLEPPRLPVAPPSNPLHPPLAPHSGSRPPPRPLMTMAGVVDEERDLFESGQTNDNFKVRVTRPARSQWGPCPAAPTARLAPGTPRLLGRSAACEVLDTARDAAVIPSETPNVALSRPCACITIRIAAIGARGCPLHAADLVRARDPRHNATWARYRRGRGSDGPLPRSPPEMRRRSLRSRCAPLPWSAGEPFRRPGTEISSSVAPRLDRPCTIAGPPWPPAPGARRNPPQLLRRRWSSAFALPWSAS